MKFLVAVAVLVLVSAQAFADELGDNNNWEPNYWSDWSDAARNKVELPLSFEPYFQRISKRPKSSQFYGLMGKRDAGYGPLSQKRSSEWNAAQIYERRRK